MFKGIRVFTFIAVSFLFMHLVTDWSDEQIIYAGSSVESPCYFDSTFNFWNCYGVFFNGE